MPPSWKTGLVNALPVPNDKRKKKKRTTPSSEHSNKSSIETSEAATSFPFLLLPPEIRTKIYHILLFPPAPSPTNQSDTPRTTTALLLTSHLIHSETTYILYTHTPFPLFPIQTFPPLPTPLLIPARHRPTIKTLHLPLGSSWTAPPKSWRVTKLFTRALPKFTNLRMLKIFVEVDPSMPMFEKYRVSKDFYTDFAGNLLRDVLKALPQVESVEVGGNGFVDFRGDLVRRVVEVVGGVGKRVVWSAECRERARRLGLEGRREEEEVDQGVVVRREEES